MPPTEGPSASAREGIRVPVRAQSGYEKTVMDARENEKMLLDRCVFVAQHPGAAAGTGAEANVFRLAGSVLRSRLPAEASRLKAASAAYFAQYPEQRLPTAEVVGRGLVVSLPRLRDMLSRRLHWNRRA